MIVIMLKFSAGLLVFAFGVTLAVAEGVTVDTSVILSAAIAASASAVTYVASRRTDRAQANRADSEADLNWQEVADRAARRHQLMMARCDILETWQAKALPILRECGQHTPALRVAVAELFALNGRSALIRKADEVVAAEIARLEPDAPETALKPKDVP